MFTHFSYASKTFPARHNLQKNLRALSVGDEARKAIYEAVHQKISTIAYRGKTLYIKTDYFPLANEIKLKERIIKDKLKKQGVVIDAIHCLP